MDSPKQIIAIASRYGIVIQHTFSDLYSAIIFLKKGAREGKHLALGAFDPSNGVVYTLDDLSADPSPKVLNESLKNFIDMGINALRVEVY
ncbi:hypothetical protein [Rufibacter sp. XAAS-G3-1]|uniref:hypothetical protein n=1 Tax=Rufibacter sp. XAAS-G3-1 TaxID=2729134 RepID=UPI0015E64C6B|nr:hypothetical protein [Rufibacter sp. XAAS-G3-1]